jgi:hypothetical protein
MTALQVYRTRPDPSKIGAPVIALPSYGSSPISNDIVRSLEGLVAPTPTFSGRRPAPAKGLDEQLYDALADFKMRTAFVAMHIGREWRSLLFKQLDSLLAVEDWDTDDPAPSLDTFSTFLRMLTLLRPERRPGLGATVDGHLIAAWTSGDDRLTIECLPKDIVRWRLSATIEGEREHAAAETPLQRLRKVLEPYDPARWFDNADNVPAA